MYYDNTSEWGDYGDTSYGKEPTEYKKKGGRWSGTQSYNNREHRPTEYKKKGPWGTGNASYNKWENTSYDREPREYKKKESWGTGNVSYNDWEHGPSSYDREPTGREYKKKEPWGTGNVSYNEWEQTSYDREPTEFKKKEPRESGAGNRMSDDKFNYYKNISGVLKNAEGEERDLIVDNLLKDILEQGNDGRKLAYNRLVSAVIETCLKYASVSQALSMTQLFSEEIRSLCEDKCASHVLQTLMIISYKFIQGVSVEKDGETEVNVTEEQQTEFVAFLNKVGRFVYNNLGEFMYDSHASHIFRSVLETCSGVQVEGSVKSGRNSHNDHSIKLNSGKTPIMPPDLKTLLADIGNRLLMLPDLPGIITTPTSSASLQAALMVFKGIESDMCPTLVDHLMKNGFPNILTSQCDGYGDNLGSPLVFDSTAAVRMLEVVIQCSSPSQLNKLYEEYFKGRIPDLVKHKTGNFAVQKLLLSWKDKDEFYSLCEETCQALPAAMEVKHTGVVFALAKACQVLGKCQGQCWKEIMRVIRCYDPHERQVSAAPCLMWLLNYDDYMQKRSTGSMPPVSLHGSLILQEFLQYTRTMKVVDSVMAMDSAELVKMACDPRASHVIDCFMSSSFINISKKEKLINSFKGKSTALACSRHGSRSLESMWGIASIKIKTDICEELVKEETKLLGDRFGTIIYNKFMVRLFKGNNKQNWEELVHSAAKKKKKLDDLLTDITADEPKETISEPPKKKKKKKNKDKV